MKQDEFEARYLTGLNELQRNAVSAPDKPLLILAVPGSGKTTVLVNRIGYLVHVLGVKPGHILTITFTTAAAKEMSQRYEARFGSCSDLPCQFRTINSVCLNIVRKRFSPQSLSVLGPQDEGMVRSWIRANYARLTGTAGAAGSGYVDENTVDEIKTAISFIKNMDLTGKAEIDRVSRDIPNLSALYDAYCSMLRDNRKMDFDDQLLYAKEILTHDSTLLERFRTQFRYILVDEAQDTSRIQHEIIRLLAAPQNHLFMVGDEDQSIYGFRAAYPDALTEFSSTYPDGQVLHLSINYRSTPAIVRAAGKFISSNPNRFDKEMCANTGEGSELRQVSVLHRGVQALYLAESLHTLSGTSAVLFRYNDSALPLIDLFDRRGLPYCARLPGIRFFESTVVRDAAAFITLACHPTHADAFRRVFYRMGLKLRRETAEAACAQTKQPILEYLADMTGISDGMGRLLLQRADSLRRLTQSSASVGMQIIWDDLQYGQYVKDNGLDRGKFEILRMLAANEDDCVSLLRRLEALRLLVQNKGVANAPVFSTIHSAKGLEYDNVYLYDVFESVFPRRSLRDCSDEADLREYYEERRLFYVAMTRARKELCCFVSSASSEFGREYSAMAPRTAVPDALSRVLRNDPLGKTFPHRQFGDGCILAESADSILLRFPDRQILLLSRKSLLEAATPAFRARMGIAQKAIESEKIQQEDRDRLAAEAAGLLSRLQPGSRIRLLYDRSEGTITRRDGVLADILFTSGPDTGTTAKFSLQFLTDNGKIEMI